MPNEVSIVDPLGKTIHVLPVIIFSENEAEGSFDDVTAVIKKPAMLVQVDENNATQFYYFRSIGWHRTLLITTRWNNNRWEAYSFTKNPTSTSLSELLKKGHQLI